MASIRANLEQHVVKAFTEVLKEMASKPRPKPKPPRRPRPGY